MQQSRRAMTTSWKRDFGEGLERKMHVNVSIKEGANENLGVGRIAAKKTGNPPLVYLIDCAVMYTDVWEGALHLLVILLKHVIQLLESSLSLYDWKYYYHKITQSPE